MPLEDLINRLGSLSITDGQVSVERVLKTYAFSEFKAEDEDVIRHLRLHLTEVYCSTTEAASSASKLRKVAQLNGKGLLKIAQTGLKNTKGGAEPLHLACDALQALLVLSPFIKTGELSMEKLFYQAIARSVDLGKFSLGLRAAAFLQTALRQRDYDPTRMTFGESDTSAGVGAMEVETSTCLPLVRDDSERRNSALYLRSFEHPDIIGCNSLEMAKLVSGACLNTCRCCLEVGSVEALELMVGDLGRSAGTWIGKVSELGEEAKAEAYRDHLFKLLWKACSSLEQEPLVQKAPSTLQGRQMALKLLTDQRESWDTCVFISMAHRGAVLLERRAGVNSAALIPREAAQLSAFCYRLLCTREGARWPVREGTKDDGSTSGFQATWVDWLQYSAGLQERIEDHAAAQRLLQLAYEYVRECWKQIAKRVKDGTDTRAISCVAYSAILKIHAALTITSQYHRNDGPPSQRSSKRRGDSNTSNNIPCNQPGTPQGSHLDDRFSVSVVYGHLSRALEYTEDLCDALGTLARATAQHVDKVEARSEVGIYATAAVKAWKWVQKASATLTQWAEEGMEEQVMADTSKVGRAQWLRLGGRNLRVTGDLSRLLATLKDGVGKEWLARTPGIPSAQALVEIAFDTYLRVARDFINCSFSGGGTAGQGGNGTTASRCLDETDETEVRKCLDAMARMCETRSGPMPLHGAKRAGVGWFGFGQRLVENGDMEKGLDALLCGCHLLETWLENQAKLAAVPYPELLQSAQLDLRLSKISKILMELQDFSSASAVIARALCYRPDLWRLSPDDAPEPSLGVEALVDRFVSCRVRCEGTIGPREQSIARLRDDDGSMARRRAWLYLKAVNEGLGPVDGADGVPWDIARYLQSRALPDDAIASVLLAECRSFRSQVSLDSPEASKRNDLEGVRVLFACVTGHRGATNALLGMCKAASATSGGGIKQRLTHADQWEAHAHVLSAWFEHDLFLMKATSTKAWCPDDECRSQGSAAQVVADLPGAIGHVLLGNEDESALLEHYSPTSAAVAGVFACLRAILVRDLAEPADTIKQYMRRALDLLNHAIRSTSNGYPESARAWVKAGGATDAETILACLKILEAHYALHRDTAHMVRSVELRVLFAKGHGAGREAIHPARKAAFEARALSDVGSALHGDGVPAIASALGAAAQQMLSSSTEMTHEAEASSRGERYPGQLSAWTSPEVVRAAAEMLRGLCLGEKKGRALEAEAVLREARRIVSEGESVGTVAAAAAAAVAVSYLQCVAGLGLSWLYERRGRLLDAMTELKKVLRLCHTWASSSTALSGSDRQVLCLQAERGASIHDERSLGELSLGGERALAEKRVEEGIGEETGEVEETIHLHGTQSVERQEERIVLSSMWLPIYVESLMRMGRLWRARGFASKASGYLRQGCVIAEPLHASRLLRDCLVEEVEVAARMNRFDRATRLLAACQNLLEQERRDRGMDSDANASARASAKGGSFVPGCPICDPSLKLLSGQNKIKASTQTKAHIGTTRGGASTRGPGRGTRKGTGRTTLNPLPSKTSLTEGLCLRCRQLYINSAALLVIESNVLRRKGDFEAALAACKRGQAALTPLVEVAGRRTPLDCRSLLPEVGTLVSRAAAAKVGESNDLGWCISEISGALRLQQARVSYLLGEQGTAKELYEKCAKTEGARVLVRAEALYRLGRMGLDHDDVLEAMEPLRRAETLMRGTGAPKLVRRVRRALAVALTQRGEGKGRGPVAIDGSWHVGALSSLSVGTTHCNHLEHLSAKKERSSRDGGRAETHELSVGMRLFGVVSGRMKAEDVMEDERSGTEGFDSDCGGKCLSQAVDCELKPEWTIVSLCLAAGRGATKRLLITRLSRGRSPVTASVVLSREDSELLAKWKDVMDRNRETLRGHSAEEAAAWGNKEKAQWWQRRAAVDEAVDTLLHQLQERWLARYGLTPLLMGKIVEEEVEAALESVCEFAINRAKTARRTSGTGTGTGSRFHSNTRGKLGSRGSCAARDGGSRKTTTVNVDKEGMWKGMSGVFELIAACVRGGDVMTESGWLAVLGLALSGVRDEEAVVRELKGQLEKRIRKNFSMEGVVGRCEPSSSSDAGDSSERSESATDRKQGGRSERTKHGARVAPRDTERDTGAAVDSSRVAKMRVIDLRRELTARGISTAGAKLKSELVAKLIEALRHETCDGIEVDSACQQGRGRTSEDQEALPASLRQDGEAARSGKSPFGSALSKAASRDASIDHSLDGSKQRAPSDQADQDSSGTSPSTSCARRHPVILVLDEELQAMPWEALPCLRGHAVTRVPALPFVFSALAARWHCGGSGCEEGSPSREEVWVPSEDGFRLHRGFYVLDPESNLPNTRQELRPVFQALAQRHGWSGFVGEAPTEERMAKLLQDVDVFAYSGHGAGESLIGREAVAALRQCPVAVLMGCSSGRLKGYGEFEPTGMVSSYLAGGSPAVVANLWDVTDRDIDRFSVALLDLFAGDGSSCQGRQGLTLAHAVAQARSECKMAFIIGHAPVCYGIPISVAKEPSG